jgi:hypothetical protein
MPLGILLHLLKFSSGSDVNDTALVVVSHPESPVLPAVHLSENQTDVNWTLYTYPTEFWCRVWWGLFGIIIWAAFVRIASWRRSAFERAVKEHEFNVQTCGEKITRQRLMTIYTPDGNRYAKRSTKLSARHQMGALNQCASKLLVAVGSSQVLLCLTIVNLAGWMTYAYMAVNVESRIYKYVNQSMWESWTEWGNAAAWNISKQMITQLIISSLRGWAGAGLAIVAGLVNLPWICCYRQRTKLKSNQEQLDEANKKNRALERENELLRRQSLMRTTSSPVNEEKEARDQLRRNLTGLDSAASGMRKTLSSETFAKKVNTLERRSSSAASEQWRRFGRSLTPSVMSSGKYEVHGVGKALRRMPTSDEMRGMGGEAPAPGPSAPESDDQA